MDVATSTVIERIFLTVFPLVAIVCIGFLYAKKRPVNFVSANEANIDIFVPALLFSVLSVETFDMATYGYVALAAVFVILGSGLLVYPICHLLGINKKTFLPPMMFNNSGNLGLPLAVLAFGQEALSIAVVFFIIENLLHFTVGIYILNRKTNPWHIIKMPMIIATVAGLLWGNFQLPVYPAVKTFIDMLGQIAIPLMLFALGLRMTQVDFKHWKISLLAAVLCPLSGLLMAVLCIAIFPIDPLYSKYLLLFSVLPPAVLNYMVSERFQQEPEQVAAIVLISNIASLFFIPLALWFIL